MKRAARLRSLPLEQLVHEARMRSIKRSKAMREGPVRKANRQHDVLVDIRKEFRERGIEAQPRLLALMEDPGPAARCWAAASVLEFAPADAERVLAEIASTQKNAIGFEARFVLERWKEGA